MSGPQRFRKKPVEIEAWQWVSDKPETEAQAIVEWMEENWASDGGRPNYDPMVSGGCGPHGEDWGCLEIDTLEGTMEVSPYDFVIRGVQGEFYPCKPDIFAATYDEVAS
jgi:hypothetical protein